MPPRYREATITSLRIFLRFTSRATAMLFWCFKLFSLVLALESSFIVWCVVFLNEYESLFFSFPVRWTSTSKIDVWELKDMMPWSNIHLNYHQVDHVINLQSKLRMFAGSIGMSFVTIWWLKNKLEQEITSPPSNLFIKGQPLNLYVDKRNILK